VLFQSGHVVVAIPAGEQPCVNCRMKRLHATIHHLGMLRDVGNIRHLEAAVAEGAGGPTGRE
jgi:hypothetical protein